jgi:tRNA/tmRNA/rRNA uracil-C5-methylase (TrmA/RlmC/RlmD family)
MTDPVIPIAMDLSCHEQCPGCPHIGMTRRESLDHKFQWLSKILANWSDRLDAVRSVEAKRRWKYRNRVCLHTQWSFPKWKIGLMRRNEIIDLTDCPVHGENVAKALYFFSKALPPDRFFPMIFYVQSGVQSTLVVKQKTLPDLSWLDSRFLACLESTGIEGLWLHLNPCAGKNVFAKNTWRLLWGVPRSRDCNGMIYGPKSFKQLLPVLYEQALNQAEEFLCPAPDDLMVDLYCGGGAGLARWTARCARAIGVELNGEAVECAQINAPSALVLRGKCKDRIPQMNAWVNTSKTSSARRLAYVNPPRTGLEPEIMAWLTKDYRPARVAYLSCSAGTLKRDLECLEKSGYDIVRITPFDFFPQTLHVECLALLKRKAA